MIIVFRKKATINVEDIRVDKKKTLGDKKLTPGDIKGISGDKKETVGKKTDTPEDKMETPGDKEEVPRDYDQFPGEPPQVPKMSTTDSESRKEEYDIRIDNESIVIMEDIIPMRDLTIVENVQLNSVVSIQMSQSKSVVGEGKETSRVLNKVTAAPKESASTARARHSIIKTLVLVTFGFVLCWSWSEIYFLMFHLGYTHVDFTGHFFNFTIVMVFVSICINPIIYCVKFKQFQNGVKWVFRSVSGSFGESGISPSIQITNVK